MPSSKNRHYVEVGKPHPKKFLNHVETITFVIHNFKARKEKATRGDEIESPVAEAHGHEWSILVYPRGDSKFQDTSCYLTIQKNADIIAKQSWRCKGFKSVDVPPRSFKEATSWGDGLKRDDNFENILEDDSFAIEIDIHIAAENQCVWYPKKLQQQNIWVELYQDASSDTADVVFSVGKNLFQAHKSILSLRGKKLYEVAKDCDSNAPIPLHSVRAEIFKSILDFVYTVKTPEMKNKDIATELLVAADCYDCVHLKLYVESVIVDTFLAAENAAELLIVADSYSCALMKEAAIYLLVTDAETVKSTESWSKVRESNRLLEELFFASSNKRVRTSEIDQMDVTTLREALEDANIELDGSREILIHRLKTHRNTTS